MSAGNSLLRSGNPSTMCKQTGFSLGRRRLNVGRGPNGTWETGTIAGPINLRYGQYRPAGRGEGTALDMTDVTSMLANDVNNDYEILR